MKEIIKLIVKYHFTIVFIVLEILSFSLIVMHNSYQRTVFSNATASVFGAISSTTSHIKNYFSLEKENEKLVAENTELRNQLERQKLLQGKVFSDSLSANIQPQYIFRNAEIVHSGFNKTKNYITINAGRDAGITEEMAVVGNEGVVGIVEKVTKHYAKVLPLINVDLRVSAKIQKNGYYGSLQWDGKDYRYSYLNDIPFHVDAVPGDTIVTSGFSSIFPEGELIGFVESVDRKTANFLTIKVKLAVDFKKVFQVYVIANTHKQELQELEAEAL